jgi:hypothetical protein
MPRRKSMTDALLVVNDAPYCGVIEEPRQPCSLSASDSPMVASVVAGLHCFADRRVM